MLRGDTVTAQFLFLGGHNRLTYKSKGLKCICHRKPFVNYWLAGNI